MVVSQPFGARERELLRAQLGLITRQQALGCNHSPATIKTRLQHGEWVAVNRGIYRSAVYPVTSEQSLLAECLRSPGNTWASHRSAAWLHGLMEKPNRHSVATTSRLRSGTTRVHHIAPLFPCDEAKVHGVPATSIEKTLIDVAAEVPLPQLNYMLDEAITTRKTSLAKIEWRLKRVGGHGHSGSAAIRRALGPRRRDGQVDSHLEREFLNLLEEAGLPKPHLQYRIKLSSRSLVADFAFPQHKLIVEVMGYRWHGGQDRWERDLLRSSELGAAGWRVVYVTSRQMRRDRFETIRRIATGLGVEPLFVL